MHCVYEIDCSQSAVPFRLVDKLLKDLYVKPGLVGPFMPALPCIDGGYEFALHCNVIGKAPFKLKIRLLHVKCLGEPLLEV